MKAAILKLHMKRMSESVDDHLTGSNINEATVVSLGGISLD